MKLWKYGIIIVSVSMLVLSSGIVSAQTINDGQNDVLVTIEGTCNFTSHNAIPDIDIKQITCTIEGTSLTLELEIYGDIWQISTYGYFATVETTDFQYDVSMFNGEGSAYVSDNAGSDYLPDNPELNVSEHTISAVFEIQGNATILEIFGHAEHMVTPMEQDWAPDNKGPEGSFGTDGNNTGNNTGGNTGGTTGGNTGGTTGGNTAGNNNNNNNNQPATKTPGFEAIAVIAAVGISLILLKRRK